MPEYISKESVLLKCADIWDNADETTQTGVDTINTIDKITDFIESLPAADVQPVKRGRWLPAKGWFMSKCSECGYEIGMALAPGYICCPKCTARMDGDTE